VYTQYPLTTTVLTSYNPNAAYYEFSTHTMHGNTDYYSDYVFASFISPCNPSGGTSLLDGGGGTRMYRSSDRDDCPFWYHDELYVFATYEASRFDDTGASFIIYRLNKDVNRYEIHSLIKTDIQVDSSGLYTLAPARTIWRPKAFLYNGRPLVVFVAMYDFTNTALPVNIVVGELTSDLKQMPFYSILAQDLYPNSSPSSGSPGYLLSARYIDVDPLVSYDGTLVGFIMHDNVWEKAAQTSPGSYPNNWNRVVLADASGRFVRVLTSFSGLTELGSGAVWHVKGISAKPKQDGTWDAFIGSVLSTHIYTMQLDANFEAIVSTQAYVTTQHNGMGCAVQLPEASGFFQSTYVPDASIYTSASSVTPVPSTPSPTTLPPTTPAPTTPAPTATPTPTTTPVPTDPPAPPTSAPIPRITYITVAASTSSTPDWAFLALVAISSVAGFLLALASAYFIYTRCLHIHSVKVAPSHPVRGRLENMMKGKSKGKDKKPTVV
jgi:hypothetical protein